MKIYRNGVEIELTDEELYSAFMEQQEIFNRMDVEEFTINYYSTVEDFKDVFGLTVEEFRPLMDEVVDAYRDRPIDCYEEVQDAAFTVIQRHKNQHNLCEIDGLFEALPFSM